MAMDFRSPRRRFFRACLCWRCRRFSARAWRSRTNTILRSEPMPIRLNLDRVMSERQITLTELADKVGITLANLSILKTNKARAIRFSTLEALCRVLQCQPGELIEFVAQGENVS